jgi:hypothetical protein
VQVVRVWYRVSPFLQGLKADRLLPQNYQGLGMKADRSSPPNTVSAPPQADVRINKARRKSIVMAL